MKIAFEYGQGLMEAQLPDGHTDVFIPGETVADPPRIPEKELITKTRYSIQHPIGMKPIGGYVGKDSKVAIIFPDKLRWFSKLQVIGQTAYLSILEECYAAGVQKKNIQLSVVMDFTEKTQRKNCYVFLDQILLMNSGQQVR